MSDPIIKCEGVYKIFGENAKKMLHESNGNVDAKTFQDNGCIVGVNNASFEVSKGEMLVVMGLSGSGKSTLLRCINLLEQPDSGDIFINGENIIINVPPLTEERRRGLAKQAKGEAEHSKVGIRNARKEANNEIKKLDISDDLKKNIEVDIQT